MNRLIGTNVPFFETKAETLNDLTFQDYYFRLELIARSIFEWKNLPEGMEERFIERILYNEGKLCFFDHPELGLLVAKVAELGKLNYYDNPVDVRVYGTSGLIDTTIPFDKCVIIRNNVISRPTYPTIRLFANRLTNVERTIDVNVDGQKTPYIITCTDKTIYSLKRMYQQRQDNEPVIYANKDAVKIDSVNVQQTLAPYVVDKLDIHKQKLWNECMTFLGVNNSNMDKRERLVADEVDANNDQIQICGQVMLKERQIACKQINKMFGTNISVRMRTLDEIYKSMLDDEEGSEEND